MKPVWRPLSLLVVTGLAGVLLSCGSPEYNEGEDYGNLLDSPGGLTLTEEEHEIGWGNPECTICHNLENIHLVNRTDISIDIDAIREEAIEDGIESCSDCHGTNGVDE